MHLLSEERNGTWENSDTLEGKYYSEKFKKEFYAEQDILQIIRLGIGVCLDTCVVNSDLLFYS